MKNLNISFAKLYSEIKQISDNTQLEYSLTVLYALFEKRIFDYEDDKLETFRSLFNIFYKWNTPDNTVRLNGLSRKVNLLEKAFEYERIFEIKMTEEIIIESIKDNKESLKWKHYQD